jgi:hypothetical protein
MTPLFLCLSNSGIQNTGVWAVSWSETKGCATTNIHTGQARAYCKSSCGPGTTALGTLSSTGCWNGSSPHTIHDLLASFDGQSAFISVSGTWTLGACAGVAEQDCVFPSSRTSSKHKGSRLVARRRFWKGMSDVERLPGDEPDPRNRFAIQTTMCVRVRYAGYFIGYRAEYATGMPPSELAYYEE